MTDEDVQEMISAERMIAVMTAHDDVFRNNVRAMELKTALTDDIALMNASGASGASALGLQKDGTQDKRAAEDDLEAFIRKIAANGKAIKKDDPAFDNIFRLPKESFSNAILLETARSYIEDLTPEAVAKFAEYGFTSVTPANIQTKIDAVLAGSSQQNTGRSGGVAATADERAVMQRLKANRRTLKTIGANIVEETGDAGLVAEWNSACKLEKKKKTDEPPIPPTP